MSTILIIGAGGVSRVATKKCAKNSNIFKKIVLATRTKEKADRIASEIKKEQNIDIITQKVDADNCDELVNLINRHKPQVVLNLALPYQDLTIMDACLLTGVNYVDSANYEHPDSAKFEYKEQWAKDKKFKNNNITALLGSGFDPGVTSVFCAYAQKHYFDAIDSIDIYDCNDGDHGYPFATNFNPEINIREVTAKGRYYENGKWIETEPISQRVEHNYPEIGVRSSYLMYHEELESLSKNIKGVKRIRFYMTFSDNYLNHLKVLQNVGMTRIDEVEYNGVKIVPVQFLAKLLPDPSTLGARTKGKTNIGCYISGTKDGKNKTIYIYNVSDHQKCYEETGAQGVSYTTGVPAMIGAKLLMNGTYKKTGTINLEELDPDPFMDELNKNGLPFKVIKYD